MSDLKQRERLAEMHATIVLLRAELMEREREAGELLDGEEAATDASACVAATRMLLDAAKDKYIAESEVQRARHCSIHGDPRRPDDQQPLYVSCRECCETWGYTVSRSA